MKTADKLLALLREGRAMTLSQRIRLAALLSLPSILAQFSLIAMQYVDASMVGQLGAEAAASIGLVSTTIWLFGGICSSVVAGFSVQVAHKIGAGDFDNARKTLRQALTAALVFGLMLGGVGVAISGSLPRWLGGDISIREASSTYFFIYALALPILQVKSLAGGMLRCSGDMRTPSILNILMCVLDVLFNFLLIFPSHDIRFSTVHIHLPGAGLGVTGAALGTMAAVSVTMVLMMWYLCRRSAVLKLAGTHGSYRPQRKTLVNAGRIAGPMALEHTAICFAQIMTTVIVAPLGVVAIAANSFAITAESLCYMPGYGISEAATTLVGQSVGAGRRRLAWSFANITVLSGMVVMGLMGALMYLFAPEMIGVMTPVEEIRVLGTSILRIEAFAEPMFAASIVAYGVFVGAGKTFVPSLMNFGSIWGVRLTLAALLAPSLGLRGVWIAMCIELCFRGTIFLIRLWRKKWLNHIGNNIGIQVNSI